MKNFIILIMIMMITTICYAKDFEVTTGYGYFIDKDKKITAKAELPKGKHKIKDGYKYIEVSNKEELDNINIFIKPKTQEEIYQEEINKKVKKLTRNQAIEELKQEGKLPNDFKDKNK